MTSVVRSNAVMSLAAFASAVTLGAVRVCEDRINRDLGLWAGMALGTSGGRRCQPLLPIARAVLPGSAAELREVRLRLDRVR